ncbi:MAG: glycosyltransferase [Bdellovibrionales bacterium]|nr:glycosyltransferase [Bdellovibrionales bacterium]
MIIGGTPEHIAKYQRLADQLQITKRVSLLGPRPVSALNGYLMQADILVSPRTLGNNTPMKIYSYLHSGIPVLATDLPTHTQVCNSAKSELVPATPKDVGNGLAKLLSDSERRRTIGENARAHAEEFYTFEVFQMHLNRLYDSVIL